MTTSEQTEKGGIIIPTWAIGIVVGTVLAVGGWTATTLMGLRDQCGVLTEKVRVLEASADSRSTLPLAVARLEAKLDAVSSELGAIREDIRRVRPTGGK